MLSFKINSGLSTNFRTILQLSNCSIAVTAKKSAYFIAAMTMIYMEILFCFRRIFAYSARTILFLNQSTVDRFVDAMRFVNYISRTLLNLIRIFFFISSACFFVKGFSATRAPYMEPIMSTRIPNKTFYLLLGSAFTADFLNWLRSFFSLCFPFFDIRSRYDFSAWSTP